MGKKRGSPAVADAKASFSTRTIPRTNYKHKQQDLDGLIEALRPHVYITDCSSFKSLVQELTGNSNIGITASSSLINTPPAPIQQRQQINPTEQKDDPQVDDHEHHRSREEVSLSSSSSVESSSADLWNQLLLEEQVEDQTWDQIFLDVTSSLSTDQNSDLLAAQEVESWLLDCNGYSTQTIAENFDIIEDCQFW